MDGHPSSEDRIPLTGRLTVDNTLGMLPGADELWADLDPSISHCNHGSYGAVPRPVRLFQDELRRSAEVNPNRFFRFELPGRREEARIKMAAFVGGPADNTAFVPTATA